MPSKFLLYFGHPVNTYNTALEEELLCSISERFPRVNIETPNTAEHQRSYDEWKKKTGRGMDYYFKIVLPKCDGGIFLPFRDGMWGAGVYGEAEFLFGQGKRVWEITHMSSVSSVLELPKKSKLSVEETRARVYGPDRLMLPY